MFKERSTEKLIEYIQTLPDKEQKAIVKTLSSPPSKKERKSVKKKTEQDILNGIRQGLQEIKEAKRTGKKLPDLQDLINELKNEG